MDRRSWTQQEDQAIISLVDQFGVMDWTNISQKLKQRYSINQRTGKQCRERWYNHLNPQVNKKPWTEQQQKLLFEIHRKSGNKWKLMSRYFQGRTDNDIKNHFYSTLRRSLRRLNKFIGEKNSTTQMREIKPSVLSTIMNYIYQQQNNIQTNIVNSLKDLPYLVFEFSNYKPVKGKVKVEEDEVIKEKINFIFLLINKAKQLRGVIGDYSATYQMLKQTSKSAKCKRGKGNSSNGGEQNEEHSLCRLSNQDMLTSNNYNSTKCPNNNLFSSHLNPINNAASIQLAQQLDFFKYLPKKSYSQHPTNLLPSSLQLPLLKKPKQKLSKMLKSTLPQVKIQQQQQQDDCCSNSKENKCCGSGQQMHCGNVVERGGNNSRYSIVERLERELSTDLMCEEFVEYNGNLNSSSNNAISNNNIINNVISNNNIINNTNSTTKRYNPNPNNNPPLQGLDGLKQRRISLQAYQDFIQDSDMGQVQQPSDVSGFYSDNRNSNCFQDLVVVGKQVTLHSSIPSSGQQVKVEQHHQDNSNIDQLIQMNYSH